MRILRIGILNLNSLRGEQTIDFTASPLSDHQLYAITGPTGAGKTTILDAITLALYGQTERNKSEKDRKDGSGSVMTYGTGECRAELEYTTATGKYKNVWRRQRAHKRPDRDLTKSTREISKWNAEIEDWDILATKKRDVDAKTEEVVGLDYDRFVRSVMLTQGDFARFLKSDPGDKAAILEKITGTEVYKDLSMAAYTRAKLAREAWERATEALTVAPPLEAEARTSLEEQQKEQTTAVAPLKQQLQQTDQQIAQQDGLRALRQKAQAAEADQVALEKAWEAFAPDRKRLALSTSLQPLAADLAEALRLSGQGQSLTKEFEQTQQEFRQRETAVAAAREGVVTAQGKLNVFYEKLPGREEKFNAVALLERDVTAIQRDIAFDRKREAGVTVSLNSKQAESKTRAAAIAAIRKALDGMEPAAVAARLEALEGELQQGSEQLTVLERRLQHQQIRDRLQQEQALLATLTPRLKTAVAELETANKSVNAAEEVLADRRVMHNALRLSATLSEHKANLAPGESCPVCGATEHPDLVDFTPVTDSALERAQREVNEALKALTAAKQKQEVTREQQNSLQRDGDARQALLAELRAQLPEGEASKDEVIAKLEAEQKQLKNRLKTLAAEQGRLRELRPELPRLITLETEQTANASRLAELTAEQLAIRKLLENLEATISRKASKIKAEIGERTVEQCREMLRKKKDDLVAGLAAAEKAEVDSKGQLAVLTTQKERLLKRQEEVAVALKAVQSQLAGALSGFGLTEADARQALLPAATMAELRQQEQDLTTRRATVATLAKNLAEEIAAAEALVAKAPSREALQELRTEQEFIVSEAERLIGALNLQLKQDDERVAEIAAKQQAIEGLRKETDRWQRLNDLIGSADGKKFRSYAQAITLQQLIAIGNDHLANINPRYRMEYEAPVPGAPEKLEMIIIDQYQNDNRRTMATLSGGESFLISLALALGLSDLASGKRLIQSLFIDEGFGTLDGKTLDQAMTTLEQLQAQGKTIGLISHVPQLQERIQCQLQLRRVGDGYSRVEVRG